MTTVLIPTDFTLPSLNMVKSAALRFEGHRLNIILFHALHMPTGIQDLLFLNKQVPHEKLTEKFRHTCAMLKRKHSPAIARISFRHMYGSTPAVFRNFAEAAGIQFIYMPQHVVLTRAYDNSVELRALFKKSTLPFITGPIPVSPNQATNGTLPSTLALVED
jgi:hypothetical protein